MRARLSRCSGDQSFSSSSRGSVTSATWRLPVLPPFSVPWDCGSWTIVTRARARAVALEQPARVARPHRSSTSTRSPAGASPSPGAIRARPSAPTIEVSTCEPWASLVGAARQPVLALKKADPDRLLAPRVARDRARSSAATTRGASGAAPWSAASAGPHEQLEGDHRRHGVARAGRRRACSPRTPNQVGLPGRSRTPQKRSSTPSSRSAGFTWSCGPTETPPETITTSAARAPPRAPRRVPSASSGTVIRCDHLAARPLHLGAEGVGVGAVDGAGPERRAGLGELVAGDEDGDARAAARIGARLARPTPRRPARRARARMPACRTTALRGMSSPARPDVGARARLSGTRHRRRSPPSFAPQEPRHRRPRAPRPRSRSAPPCPADTTPA